MCYLIVVSRDGCRRSRVTSGSGIIVRTWSVLKTRSCASRVLVVVVWTWSMLKTCSPWGLWTTQRSWTIQGRGKGNPSRRFTFMSTETSKQFCYNPYEQRYIKSAHVWRMGGEEGWAQREMNAYPKRPSSIVALYCEGISINAERANSVSFRDWGTDFDIISVKLTNWIWRL